MGQAVVHFEVVGKDADKLQEYYSGLFGWEIDNHPELGYGTIDREKHLNPDGVGIGGGVGAAPEGAEGHGVTFYVEVPDVDAALAKAEELGGKRLTGPMEVPGTGVVLGHFTDPEGHLVGVVKARSA